MNIIFRFISQHSNTYKNAEWKILSIKKTAGEKCVWKNRKKYIFVRCEKISTQNIKTNYYSVFHKILIAVVCLFKKNSFIIFHIFFFTDVYLNEESLEVKKLTFLQTFCIAFAASGMLSYYMNVLFGKKGVKIACRRK